MDAKLTQILLFEDNIADARLLIEILNDAVPPRFQVTHVTRLAAGLELLAERDFSIVLADLSLPDAKGLETLAAVRRQAPEIPVVVLTGLDDHDVALQALRDGAQDFLVKGHADDYQILHSLSFAIERKRFIDTQRMRPPPPANDKTMVLRSVPRAVAGYEIVRPLGAGSMSTVYLVTRGGGDQQKHFALKVMRPSGDLLLSDAAAKEMFIAEARLAASVKHANIIEVIDYGVADDLFPYIVMEYVEGQPLHRILESLQQAGVAEVTRIIRQVAEALAVIHEHGICHRDVKPSNVMLTDQRQVKVMDFGIAKSHGRQDDPQTRLIGSPAYMAPEAFDHTNVDPRADLFSLGVLAYELYLGRRPFAGETITALAGQIRRRRPVEPRKVKPDFPEALQYILARLLKKKPEERYPSARPLIADLDAFLQQKTQAAPFLEAMRSRFLQGDWS